MYTEDYTNNAESYDEYNNQYVSEDEFEQESSFWERNKNIIFKVIIIILCLIILIWLIGKLAGNKPNKVTPTPTPIADNTSNMNENLTKLRKAAEKYFFIDNKPKNGIDVITVDTLIDKGYLTEFVDINKNTCNLNSSYASLEKTSSNYVLTVNAICSKENRTKLFYYTLTNVSCTNCDGDSLLDGTINYNDDEPTPTPTPEPEPPTDDDDDDTDYSAYSCDRWTDWSTTRVDLPKLEERTRTLVKGVKTIPGSSYSSYGSWSDWTKEKITATSSRQVQTKEEDVETWVAKTSTTKVTNSETIRNVKEIVEKREEYTCKEGTLSGTTCTIKTEGTKLVKGLSATGWFGNSSVISCPNKYTDQNGKILYDCYVKTEVTTTKPATLTTKLVVTGYSYEEKTTTKETYYRSRSVSTHYTDGSTEYTDLMLESELPEGYVKLDGSEQVQYSYRLKTCVNK